jgi:hypothetical protein
MLQCGFVRSNFAFAIVGSPCLSFASAPCPGTRPAAERDVLLYSLRASRHAGGAGRQLEFRQAYFALTSSATLRGTSA